MNRRAFLASIPVGPIALIPCPPELEVPQALQFTSSRLFKYMTERGRPFAMFTMPQGHMSLWWYWVFEDESSWKLPPQTWQDSAMDGIRDWGWKYFEGNASDLVCAPFNSVDFPDTSVIEHYAQEQFHKLLKTCPTP